MMARDCENHLLADGGQQAALLVEAYDYVGANLWVADL
jgi:hypothetical protein